MTVTFEGQDQTLIDQVPVPSDANVAILRDSIKTKFSNRLAHVDSAELEVSLNQIGTPARASHKLQQPDGASEDEPIYVRCPAAPQAAAAGTGKDFHGFCGIWCPLLGLIIVLRDNTAQPIVERKKW